MQRAKGWSIQIRTFKLIVSSVIFRRYFGDVGSLPLLCEFFDPSW
jgi:hypothetical protein